MRLSTRNESLSFVCAETCQPDALLCSGTPHVTTGVKLRLEDLEYGTFRPTATCVTCQSKWEESGLERAIHNVKWDTVRTRKDVEALVCFYAFVCWYNYYYIIIYAYAGDFLL